MRTTEEELQIFSQFVLEQLQTKRRSLDELYDEWRFRHSTDDDVLAIAEALADMDAGQTGRPYEEFAVEFKRQHGLQ